MPKNNSNCWFMNKLLVESTTGVKMSTRRFHLFCPLVICHKEKLSPSKFARALLYMCYDSAHACRCKQCHSGTMCTFCGRGSLPIKKHARTCVSNNIVLHSVCMILTRNTHTQYYICDASSANPQMQAWKTKMIQNCVFGQRNDSVGLTIGFDVDGEKEFGEIYQQKMDIYERPLLVFDVVSQRGKNIVVDLRDAVDIFDGVVISRDLCRMLCQGYDE